MSAFLVLLLFSVAAASEVSKPIELLPELKNGIENLAGKLTYILFKQAPPDTNVVVSPVNIFGAFCVLLYGADGDTREEIANFLGFPNTNETYEAAHKNVGQFFRSLEITKTGPCDFPESKNASVCTYEDVSIANGIFLHKTFPLVPSSAESLRTYFTGAVENVDFVNEPVVSTNKINKWIADKTHDLIPDILKQPVDSAVRIVVASTLYFSAKWSAGTFAPTCTPPETFSTEASEVKAEYMYNHEKQVPYYAGDSFTAISLSYREDDFGAMFVLPNINITITNFMQSFSKDQVQKILSQSVSTLVSYKIPRIETKWSDDLVEPLKMLNLTGIFTSANLTKLVSQGGPLQVSKVSHSTKLMVDEKGTVATGATTFEISLRSGRVGPPPVHFVVNRPFLMIIYHKHSSVPLFTAIIRNPTIY